MRNEYGLIDSRYWTPPPGGERQCDPDVTPMTKPIREIAIQARLSTSVLFGPDRMAELLRQLDNKSEPAAERKPDTAKETEQ